MKILVFFLQKPGMVGFSVAELKALLSPFKLDLREVFKHEIKPEAFPEHPWQLNQELLRNYPFAYIEIPSIAILFKVMERAILIKAFLVPVGEAENYGELIKSIDEQALSESIQQETFAFNFETVNHHIRFVLFRKKLQLRFENNLFYVSSINEVRRNSRSV
jgi:tRNA G10  N-methylase Trm11